MWDFMVWSLINQRYKGGFIVLRASVTLNYPEGVHVFCSVPCDVAPPPSEGETCIFFVLRGCFNLLIAVMFYSRCPTLSQ